jgi:endonuclease/exonuclease/phosphatase family metal-dependent hydrolase
MAELSFCASGGRGANLGFRLATFNVQNLGRADNPGDGVYQSKLEYLASVLSHVDADVVVINEVREPESFDDLADLLPSYSRRFIADPPPGDTRRIQTGVLCRLPVLATGQWREYPAVLPGRSGEVVGQQFRRPVLWIRVELPNGDDLQLAAVHLKSRRAEIEAVPEAEPMRRRQVLGRARSAAGRMLEAAGLRCLLDDAVQSAAATHYAVLGDFNAAPHSVTLGLVAGLEDEDCSSLIESESRRLYPVTLRIPVEQAVSYVSLGRRQLFDHILVSQRLSLGLVAAGAEHQLLAVTVRRSPERQPGYPRSDHAPVWAEFRLPVVPK